MCETCVLLRLCWCLGFYSCFLSNSFISAWVYKNIWTFCPHSDLGKQPLSGPIYTFLWVFMCCPSTVFTQLEQLHVQTLSTTVMALGVQWPENWANFCLSEKLSQSGNKNSPHVPPQWKSTDQSPLSLCLFSESQSYPKASNNNFWRTPVFFLQCLLGI